MKPEDVTQELFDDMLFKVIDEENASALLSIPGVYELVSEEYNNEVLKRLEDAPPPLRPRMTKAERVKQLGLDKFTFDYALPQQWLDSAADFLKENYPEKYDNIEQGNPGPYEVILGGTVWLYDEHARYGGRPYPITPQAREALLLLAKKSFMVGAYPGDENIQEPKPKE